MSMRSRGLLLVGGQLLMGCSSWAMLLAGAATATGFVAAPCMSQHPRSVASSRAVRMMAYKVPEATQDEWVESSSHLYKERIVYLGQEIDDLVINQIISVMLFADAEDATRPQYLYINSPGGSVIACVDT